jgi:RHS repeat-associated protein
MTDGSGAIQARYDYDPYGRRTKVSGSLDSDFGYTGHYAHEPTGLELAPYRAYHSEIGRWLSEDPIGFDGGNANLYGYVHNGPSNGVDPSGLVDNTSPWQLGLEWLTGDGQRVRRFTDGDPLTEQLRRHSHIQKLIRDVCSGRAPLSGVRPYELQGWEGIPKYINDYSTILTGGLTGNLAVTYMGSYRLRYWVTDGVLTIQISNPSTIQSALRPPVLGYSEWWIKNIGGPLNNFFSTGPLSRTEQIIEMHEKVPR